MQTRTSPLPLAAASKSSIPAWLLALGAHGFLVVVLYTAFYNFGLFDNAPSATQLICWDAGWFYSVKVNGYLVQEGQSNIPFFPLFPYLWRLLGLDAVGISVVNAGLLLLSGAWLGRTFGLRRHQVLLLLSLPPVMFCLVPYAEALFFFFGVILLRGLHRQHLGLTVLGLLGCCLTRSAATLFVPALVLAEALACTSRADLPRLALRLGAGLLTVAAALGVVAYLHWQATGNALALFNSYQHWGHEINWRLPGLLHSAAGVPMLALDLLALLTMLLATVAALGLGIRWLLGWFRPGLAGAAPSRAVVFSLGYCVGIAAFMVLYQAGDLANSSRYVLATPFFGVLLAQLPRWQSLKRSARWAWVIGAGSLIVVLAVWCGWPFRFPGFFPGEAVFYFAVWAVYVGLYLVAFSAWRYDREVRTALYILNVVYQMVLLNLFLLPTWMG
jgi:hypothetical protein